MSKRKNQQLTSKEIKKLLSQQAIVILNAVDQKIKTLEKRIDKLEIRMNQNFNRLITTLDKFLKRLTTLEDEFEIMKADINRLKRVIREKLGVDIL